MVKGGLAKQRGITAKDVDKRQLRMGIKEEKEHTSSNRVAKRIALDHLAENRNYYSVLNRCERGMKARLRWPSQRTNRGRGR